MLKRAIILFGVAATLLTASNAQAERRVALVIGNATYQNVARLPNPVNDANAVADLLKTAGFEVVDARKDLGNLEFKRAVREFSTKTRDADIAIVYFAGHGIEVKGTNYLIPVDAKLASDFDVEDEALSLDRIVSALEPAKRLRLVILDACRDNPFLQKMQRTVALRTLTRGLGKVEPAMSDTLIAYAARAGSTAEDGDGTHSPFTEALLKHMAEPGLDVRIAFGRVRDEVLRTTRNKQEPFVYGSLGGSTVALVSPPEPKRPQPSAAAPAVNNPAADVRRDYELAERVGTREAWESFLAVHQGGLYANLARSQLAKLGTPSHNQAAASATPAARPGPETAPGAAAPPDVRQAALSPADARTPPAPDTGATARLLQAELQRVGCYAGAPDGAWNTRARRAIGEFNKHAGTRLDAKVASLDALDAVRGKPERVCPLVCGRGTRLEGDACVAVREPARAKPDTKPESAREPARSRREAARTPAGSAPEPRQPSTRAARPARAPAAQSSGFSSPLCQSAYYVGNKRCCSYDPPSGPPRIICP